MMELFKVLIYIFLRERTIRVDDGASVTNISENISKNVLLEHFFGYQSMQNC